MKTPVFKLMAVMAVALVLENSCRKEDSDKEEGLTTVTFGTLLPLTGGDSDEGRMAQAAVQCALSDLNNFMAAVGSAVRYNCMVKDMQSDSAVCLEKAKEFKSQGICLLLGGPYNSNELAGIKSYLDNNGMLMLNAYSTSPSLAIAGDNIFRLLPDDTKQAKGTAALLRSDSVLAAVPFYVNDDYGSLLKQCIASEFQVAGGQMLTGVPFSPGTTEFSTLVSSLNDQVTQACAQYGSSRVAVVLVTGEETLAIFRAAQNFPGLAAVRWVGTDGSACQNNITADPSAARFAMDVHFMASAYVAGMSLSGSYLPEVRNIIDRIAAATGLTPNSNTLNVYDALKIYSMACQSVGKLSLPGIKTALPLVCKNYYWGDLTCRELNEAGDIARPVYGFWGVSHDNGTYSWKLNAFFFSSTGMIAPVRP